MTKHTLGAALSLGLVKGGKETLLGKNYAEKRSVKENILSALDEKVLADTAVEYYLALFYAYYLGLNETIYDRFDTSGNGWDPSLIDDNEKAKQRLDQTWANHFNKDVPSAKRSDRDKPNPFNHTKYAKLYHWYSYMGLGWHDPRGQFMPDPTERLLRALPSIFGSKKKKLNGDTFMEKLAESCPELDGGKLFLEANKYQEDTIVQKQCTLGLSQALVGFSVPGSTPHNSPNLTPMVKERTKRRFLIHGAVGYFIPDMLDWRMRGQKNGALFTGDLGHRVDAFINSVFLPACVAEL